MFGILPNHRRVSDDRRTTIFVMKLTEIRINNDQNIGIREKSRREMKEQATNNDEDGVNLSGQDQFVHGREVNDDNNVIMRRSFKLAKSVARRRREAVGATGKGTEHKVNSDDYKVAHRKEVESGNIIFKATRAGSGSPSGLALSGSINSMRVKSIGEKIRIV
ncbi:hypothetical protein Tco_0520048 [Tanacetum coccineum]